MIVDVEALIKLVGVDGARAALRASTTVSMKDLRTASAASLPASATRAEVVDAILAPHDKRITRSLEELQKLTEAEVIDYLRSSRCSEAELMLFLDRAKIPYPRGLSRSRLIAEAARQISRLGLFDHIAGGPKLSVDVPVTSEAEGRQAPIEGVWYSELGGRLVLRVEDGVLRGSYHKPDGSEHALLGQLGAATSQSRRLVSFTVVWSDGRVSSAAATAWVGYFDESEQGIAVHSWILIEGVSKSGRVATSVGMELFRRRPPQREQLDFAKKFNETPFPHRGRD